MRPTLPPTISAVRVRTRRRGGLLLAATARPTASGPRIVAVTFLLDGRPVGTATTTPYRVEVPVVAPGRHRVRAQAVDSLGRRARSATLVADARSSATPSLTASPTTGLGRALAALRAGHVSVRLAPGRYELRNVVLGPHSELAGAGAGTVLAAPAGPYGAILSIATPGVRVHDLALDGGGPGGGHGFAVSVGDGARDVRLQRLRITRARTDGVSLWGAHTGVSVQDSVIDGGTTARAGVFDLGSEASAGTSVVRTRITRFRSYGITFAFNRFGRPRGARRSLALDNAIAAIRDPTVEDGTSEGGIWSGGGHAAIIHNRIRRTGWDGIETVGSSTGSVIARNDIAQTPTGIYVEHATNRSLFHANAIARVRTAINVEYAYGGVASSRNTFSANRITAAGGAGVFVDVGSDGNLIVGNRFHPPGVATITLQGSSANVVRGNRACGMAAVLVIQRTGQAHGGGFAAARDNLIAANGAGCRAAGR